MKYYPVFLNLKGRKSVVIGGGRVAERKALMLIKAGALVKIISPTITKTLERYKKRGLIKHIKRNYKSGDLKGAFVIVAGTSSQETNRRIAEEAEHLINVIDAPSEGNFIAPSIVKRGPLTIAISTEGSSPAVSKAIRKEIERHYGTEFTPYMRFVGLMRKKAIKEIKEDKKREAFLKALASEEIFNALRNEGLNAVLKKYQFILTKTKK